MQKELKSTVAKLAAVSLAAATLVPALASCSGGEKTAKETTAVDKSVFIGQVNPPITWNPINAPDIASQYDQTPLFDSLLDMVEPLKFLPKLAETFELKDSTTILIKIAPDAKWTDGEPVTAEDVAFTINMVANPKTETSVGVYIASFAGLDDKGKLPEGQTSLSSLDVVDEKTLEIGLRNPVDLNMIKEQFGVKLLILPKHVFDGADPATLSQNPFFTKLDVTSGPYKFVKYEKDQYVEYVANHDYYRGAPKIEHLFIKLIPATNMAAQLEAGEIHFNTGLGIGLIPSTDFEAVKKIDSVRTKIEPNTSVQMLLYNVQRISDPKVRQAIAYAINRPMILEKLLKGSGEIVDPPYTSLNPYLSKKIPSYTYAPAKAKELLAEAKWDANRVIELVVPIGNKDREQSANIIAQNLTDVGIKVNMTKFDFPTIMQKGRKHEFDLLMIGNNFLLDPDGISIMMTKGSALNFSDYQDQEVTDLFQAGKKEPSPEKRHEIYEKMQRKIHDDLPLITLYSYQELVATSKKLIKGEPRFFGTFYDVNEWDLQ